MSPWKKLPALLTRAFFAREARPISIPITGVDFVEATPATFKTGSLGWKYLGKKRIDVGGVEMGVQIHITITVMHSKTLPQDGPNGPVAAAPPVPLAS